MKRAFIRLFGCILSAIGLSMSYDTTFTMLLDADSAPGAAWATGSTGSGSAASGGSVPGYVLVGLTGVCSYGDMNVNYDVYLSDYWYVGWLNLNYGGTVPYSQWPVMCEGGTTFALSFSGTSSKFSLNGSFGPTRKGTGTSYESRATMNLCTGYYGYLIGTATGLGDASYASAEQWRNGCVMDTRSDCLWSRHAFGAVYVPSATPFANMGCCKVTSSSYATGTGCKCFYGYANQAYSYTYMNNNVRTTATTTPFKNVYIDFRYAGCKAGYYAANNVANGTQFVRGLMDEKNLTEGAGPCPDQDSRDSDYLGMTIKNQSSYFTNFWENCGPCASMTAIDNKSSFSPTITSNGTMSLTTSDSGTGMSTCNAIVSDAEDKSGTFDIVGSCSYAG